MKPYYEDGSVTLWNADVLDGLAQIKTGSVHCVVTSPPYWGLRDYGEDGQLGLEATPEEYVARMVEVFREVWRVLRDDGTLWLNLGASYAGSDRTTGRNDAVRQGKPNGGGFEAGPRTRVSGGSDPTPSPLLQRVPACGSDGTKPQDFRGAGLACPDCGGEHPAENLTHCGRNERNGQPLGRLGQQHERKDRDSEHQGSASTSPDASHPSARGSSARASFRSDRAVAVPVATASASQPVPPTSSPDAQASAHTSVCNCGTAPMSPPLVVRTTDTESFFSACGLSDCRGVGMCGICWCNLAIPSLSFKQKDLVSIPQLVAFALQADGWWLRSDIIWHKPNPMPESVTDRPTKAHEYLFLLTKSARYYYDADAIAEESSGDSGFAKQRAQGVDTWKYGRTAGGNTTNGVGGTFGTPGTRNKRTVWTISTKPFSEAHFATFPPELPELCIKAGCPEGGTVLDPFAGSGTVLWRAIELNRKAMGIELNATYCDMILRRCSQGVLDLGGVK